MFVLKGTVRAPSMTMHLVPILITILQRLYVHFSNHLHFFCTFQICDWVKQACSARMAWKSFLLPVGCSRKNWCLISFPEASIRLCKSFSSMKRIHRGSKSVPLSTWRTMNRMCLQRTQCPFFAKSEHVHDWTVMISTIIAAHDVWLFGTK